MSFDEQTERVMTFEQWTATQLEKLHVDADTLRLLADLKPQGFRIGNHSCWVEGYDTTQIFFISCHDDPAVAIRRTLETYQLLIA